MNTSIKRTLTGTAALVAFAVAAVLILVLADAFFPKYVPTLNQATVDILESMTPSGAQSPESALASGYYEMVEIADLDAWNSENGVTNGAVQAAYRAVKGDFSGTYYIETSTRGFQNGEIVLITAIAADGTLLKILPRRITDSYYRSSDLDSLNAFFADRAFKVSDVGASVLKPFIHDASATYTTNGLANGIVLSSAMFQTLATQGGADNG